MNYKGIPESIFQRAVCLSGAGNTVGLIVVLLFFLIASPAIAVDDVSNAERDLTA